MNLNAVNRLATLVTDVMDSKKSTVPPMETLPQKPDIMLSPVKNGFERVFPEKAGVPSSLIFEYIEKIKADKTLNMHNIMILRGNKVIYRNTD